MGNEKEKKNPLIIVTIVLAIAVIGLTGFIIFDKLTANSNESVANEQIEDKKDNNEESEKKEESVIDSRDKYEIILSDTGGRAILYKGEVYVDMSFSYNDIEHIYGEASAMSLLEDLTNARNSKYKEYDLGDLEVITPEKATWMKLNTKDVKAIRDNIYGQALSSDNPKYGIIMLYDDNTVAFASMFDLIKGKTDVKKLSITDVSGVQYANDDGYTTYLVTNDGKKVNINDLVK